MKLRISGLMMILLITVSLGSTVFTILSCNLPEKTGHPKLSSKLNHLIEANKQGDAEAFAKENMIDLVNGNVKVMITPEPGQVEAATQLIERYGEIIYVLKISSHGIGANVPINRLITLANEKSIKFIEVPARIDFLEWIYCLIVSYNDSTCEINSRADYFKPFSVEV